MVKPPASVIYEFEDFRLNAAHLMLYRGGEEISLAPKAARTLLTLVERRGEIVSKDELMETIWNDSIVEEANLTQYVHVLRKTLGTAADGRPLIETLRRRGYRFNGDVRRIEAQKNGVSLPLVSGAQPADKIEPNRRIILKTIALTAFAGLLFLGVSAFLNSRNNATTSPAITLKRLTPDRNVTHPTISPDGKYLIYSAREKDATTLWLKDLTSGSEGQIMPDGVYMDLAFSSDGKQIYYLSPETGSPNLTLIRVPVSGGKPEIILKNVISPPAVAPDGKRIAILKADSGLTILDENGESANTLDSLMPRFRPIMWNSQMSWSPDGTRIALCGKDEDGRARILDFSVKDKTGQYFPTPNFSEIDDALWLADGSGLLVTAREKSGEPFQIWRVAYPSGEAWRITRDFNDYNWISLSADSKTLVVGQNITKTNVWIASFDDLENPRQITFGSEAQDGYRGLAFAPDGKIIFTSPRSGNVDLWQMNADGSNQQPLTNNEGGLNISPRITSDGRYIVFASSRGGDRLHIWRMDADGRNALQLTRGTNGDERFFDVSTDGNRIFYASANAQQEMRTWQISINGGEPSALADNYRTSGTIAVSPDGNWLMRYVYLPETEQGWHYGIFPTQGGEPLKLLVLPAYRNLARWTADGKSLLYIKPGTAQIWRQSIDGEAPAQLADFKNASLFNFVISPDYKQIVFAHGSQFSEAVLIENFGKQ